MTRIRSPPSFRISTIILLIILLPIISSALPHRGAPSPIRLSWINGIGHTKLDTEDGSEELGKVFGLDPPSVHCCFNPTAKSKESDLLGYGKDLHQAGITQKLFGRETPEVDALVSHLRSLVSEVSPTGRVVHIAHSQGALITAMALRRLSADEQIFLDVITFGGAAAITVDEFPHLSRRINYYSTNDPLLYIVPAAYTALRSGFTSLLSSGVSTPEFVFLAPRAGDPVIDHGLLGPTYSVAVAWEGRNFRFAYGSPSRPVLAAALLIMTSIRDAFTSVEGAVAYIVGRFVILPIWLSVLWAYARSAEALQALSVRILRLWEVLAFYITEWRAVVSYLKGGRRESFEPIEVVCDGTGLGEISGICVKEKN